MHLVDLDERVSIPALGSWSSENRLLAFHCTRLLPHEIESIVSNGLEPFEEDLFVRKVAEARAHGWLSAERAAERSALTMFGSGDDGYRNAQISVRAGRVWLFTGRETFADVEAVRLLLTRWGGEGTYFRDQAGDSVEDIGVPAIVKVGLDVARPERAVWAPVGLDSLLNPSTEIRRTDLMVSGRVEPDEIQQILTPADGEFSALVPWPIPATVEAE